MRESVRRLFEHTRTQEGMASIGFGRCREFRLADSPNATILMKPTAVGSSRCNPRAPDEKALDSRNLGGTRRLGGIWPHTSEPTTSIIRVDDWLGTRASVGSIEARACCHHVHQGRGRSARSLLFLLECYGSGSAWLVE